MMPRSQAIFVVLTLALALTAIGCKDDSKNAAGPAGKVTTLEGKATAVRGDEGARKLEVGSVVFADDRITAGAKGSVTIKLDRNGAALELANGASQVVSESPAWRAPTAIAGSSLTDDVNDPSVAAGRDGTREAADRPEIAAANNNPASENPDPESGDGVAGPRNASKSDKNSETAGGDTGRRNESGTKQDADKTAGKDGDLGLAENRVGGSPKEKEKGKTTGETKSGGGNSAAQIQPRKNGKLALVSVTPTSQVKAMERHARRRNHGVAVCLVHVPGKLELKVSFSISANGSVTDLAILGGAKLDKEQAACVKRSLGRSYDKELGGTAVKFRGSYQ